MDILEPQTTEQHAIEPHEQGSLNTSKDANLLSLQLYFNVDIHISTFNFVKTSLKKAVGSGFIQSHFFAFVSNQTA